MRTVSEEFIKQGHAAACSEWKKRIEQEFPDLFERELNKWYKLNGSHALMVYFTGKYGNDASYGFGMRGDFFSTIGAYRGDTFELATHEEVQSALIREAKSRGFVGVEINPVKDYNWTNQSLICSDIFSYDVFKNLLYVRDTSGYWQEVFKEGEWASVVENTTELTVAEIEKRLGYKVKIVK